MYIVSHMAIRRLANRVVVKAIETEDEYDPIFKVSADLFI
jgi:hypothetical protein